MVHPPKLVFDSEGELVEVIVSADDFRAYLEVITQETDWEHLASHLQDAVDLLLIEDVRAERDEAVELEALLDESDS